MTEQREPMDEVIDRLKHIESGMELLKDQSDFWHKPSVAGGRTRAQQVEDLLAALKAGGLISRGLLWVAGFIIAIGAAVPHVRGWIGK